MSHTHSRSTVFTLVTESGITFTPCSCGVLLGGVGPVGKRLASRIVSGALLVTTPRRAGGAYRERGAGGVYATINPKARLLPLLEQMLIDPRASAQEGAEVYSAIEAAYGIKG